MTARLLFLGLLGAFSAFGQYIYDVSGSVYSAHTSMSQNGAVDAWTPAAQFNTGGSLIWTPTVSGAVPSDYEINTTLALAPGGGTYIHYLRASAGALASPGSCAGSYFSVEVVVPTTYTSGGAAALLFLRDCYLGTLSFVGGGFPVSVLNGSVLRTVVYGSNLRVYLDGQEVVNWGTISYLSGPSGQPGIGGYGMAASSGFSNMAIGHRDTVNPFPVSATSVRFSAQPTQVSLAWDGASDDAAGIGVFGYYVTRGLGPAPSSWTFLGVYTGTEMTDTVAAGTTYTYLIYSVDFHFNQSSYISEIVTTPTADVIDARRVGVTATGSYWGGGGEQIDTQSGNLNFSLPLVTAQGRTGWSVPIGLTYNSQNWRSNTANWQLGADVGYGYGWKMQIGSITPVYLAWPYGVCQDAVFSST